MSENPLQPLAEALLASRRENGTWPEPLDWLAREVLEHGSYESCRDYWIPCDPATLHWPEGWAIGLGLKWRKQYLYAARRQKWYDVLGDSLSDSVYAEGDDDAIAALVEAVKAIAEGPHE